LIIDKGNLSLKQYEESDPPYRLPDNMDVFSWSVPFLAEKVTNMLFNILKRGGGDEDDEVINLPNMMSREIDSKQKRQLIMRGKVSSIARLTRMYTTLREESEMLLKIKNISPDGKLPRGLLLEGKPAIKNGMLNHVITDNIYSS
jgi:serine/threonine-protein phosphatase 2B catalytic subunit